MSVEFVLISSGKPIPQALQALLQQRGLVIPTLEALLDVAWDRKPETLFYDLRGLSADIVRRSLQVIAANFSP